MPPRAARHVDALDLARAGVIRHAQACLYLDHCVAALEESSDSPTTTPRSNTSVTRHRLSLDKGRDSWMRTRSPSAHTLLSSCALNRVWRRTAFL